MQPYSTINKQHNQPLCIWLSIILIFIDIFTYINLLILLIKEPFNPAPTDGNGKTCTGKTSYQQLD